MFSLKGGNSEEGGKSYKMMALRRLRRTGYATVCRVRAKLKARNLGRSWNAWGEKRGRKEEVRASQCAIL